MCKTKESWEIRLLGPLEVLCGGELQPLPAAKKAKLLLAYLIYQKGEPCDRTRVGQVLWPESEPESARFNLRQLLQRIKKEAPGLHRRLVSYRANLTFDLSGCWVDLFEFQGATRDHPKEAIALHRGELLEGLDSDWIEGPRADTRGRYIRALATMADNAEPMESLEWL